VESRLAKVEKQAKVGADKDAKKMCSLLEKYRDALSKGISCRAS